MKKLHESLFILHKCDLNIRTVWKAIWEHQSKKGPLIAKNHYTINLTHYIILETQSFIEEYQKYFIVKYIEQEFSQRILIARKLCKPLFQQIAKWKGLNNFRDNIIAHPWREKGKFVVALDSKYDIPRTWVEFQFLKDLVHYIHDIIVGEFEIEMNESLYYGEQLSKKVPPKFTIDDINQEIKLLHVKLSKLSEFEVRDYKIQINTYSAQ